MAERVVKSTLPMRAPTRGMRMSFTREEMILPNAPPMITPTAMSMTLPFIAKSLKSLGCDIGCMCCNTAHYAVSEIAEKSGLRFINLLEEVARQVNDMKLRNVMMFCSDGARKFNIYGRVFQRVCPSCELVYPSESDQALVTKVICGVKTKARFDLEPEKQLRDLVANAGFPVVLGCTDLRIALPAESPLYDNVAVDSLECLADSIIGRFKEGEMQ